MSDDEATTVPSQSAGGRHLGRRLQQTRQQRGLRLVDVAKGIVSVGYLSMIEQGQRRPSPEVIRALARRLDVDVAVLEADSLGSPRLDDVMQWQDACWSFAQGDLHDAAQRFADIIDKQSTMVPHATRWLARTYFDQGRCDEALQLLLRPVAELHDEHDVWTSIFIDLLIGLCLLKLGDLDAAEPRLQAAVDGCRESLPGSNMQMYSLGYLGRCHVRRGHMQAALTVFSECYQQMELLTLGGNLESLAQQSRQTALAAREADDLVGAIRWNERANIFANLRRVSAHGASLALEIAAFHLRVGSDTDLVRAHDIAMRTQTVLNSERTAWLRSQALLIQAEVALRRKDPHGCLLAVDSATALTPDWDRPWALSLRAHAHELLGDTAAAVTEAEAAARAIRQTSGQLRRTDELAEPWEVLAALFRRLGQPEQAWECMRQAVAGAGVPTTLVELATAR